MSSRITPGVKLYVVHGWRFKPPCHVHHCEFSYVLQDPIYVAIPHVMSRSSAVSREAVVKAMMDGEWRDLPTQDVTFDTHKVGQDLVTLAFAVVVAESFCQLCQV